MAKLGYGMVCRKKRNREHHYFVDPTKCQTIVQMECLETTILMGLGGEKILMVLSATLPGHSVPLHSHPHEQVSMVYAGKATLKIGGAERLVKKGDSTVSLPIYFTATPTLAESLS